MSRFEDRLNRFLLDDQHRAGYYAAQAEAALTDAIDNVRKSKGLSQEALGEELGISQSAVSQFLGTEDGMTIGRLAEYLSVLDLRMHIQLTRADLSAEALIEVDDETGIGTPDVSASADLFAALARSVKKAVNKSPATKARTGLPNKSYLRVVEGSDNHSALAS